MRGNSLPAPGIQAVIREKTAGKGFNWLINGQASQNAVEVFHQQSSGESKQFTPTVEQWVDWTLGLHGDTALASVLNRDMLGFSSYEECAARPGGRIDGADAAAVVKLYKEKAGIGRPFLPRDLESPARAVHYAKFIARGRFPEGEPLIVTDPFYAMRYACDVLKTRWPEAEPIIVKKSGTAQTYARMILQARWLEAEPVIASDPTDSWAYEDSMKLRGVELPADWKEVAKRPPVSTATTKSPVPPAARLKI